MKPRSRDQVVQVAELFISHLLRIGVMIAAGVVAVGWVGTMTLPEHDAPLQSSQVVASVVTGKDLPAHQVPATVSGIGRRLAHWEPQAVVTVGVLFLIALPVLRVAALVLVFGLQRDWMFTLLAGIVLLFLLSSIFLGKAL